VTIDVVLTEGHRDFRLKSVTELSEAKAIKLGVEDNVLVSILSSPVTSTWMIGSASWDIKDWEMA
jgi:hypothetical protein